MFNKLVEYRTRKVFANYVKAVNELYQMYCEMNDKINDDIDIFDKAKELDEHYENIDVHVTGPSQYVRIRKTIINNYKIFNVDYRKSKQPKNTFTQEFVEDVLAKEDCKLTSRYINSNEYLTYTYDGETYKCTFNQWWNKGYRPHLGFYGDGKSWAQYYRYINHK